MCRVTRSHIHMHLECVQFETELLCYIWECRTLHDLFHYLCCCWCYIGSQKHTCLLARWPRKMWVCVWTIKRIPQIQLVKFNRNIDFFFWRTFSLTKTPVGRTLAMADLRRTLAPNSRMCALLSVKTKLTDLNGFIARTMWVKWAE